MQQQNRQPTTYVIGCGGIGAWQAQALGRLLPEGSRLVLIDKDKIEKKNLDRQLFVKRDIGKNKAEALARHLGPRLETQAEPEFFHEDYELEADSIVFGGVDNHPARINILKACDRSGSCCFLAGNEYWDSEAYYYQKDWSGTELDPRWYYPDLLTDTSGDPLQPSCTGEVQEADPQLATANMNAAGHSMFLYTFWRLKQPELEASDTDFWPVHVFNNFSKTVTLTKGDKLHGHS